MVSWLLVKMDNLAVFLTHNPLWKKSFPGDFRDLFSTILTGSRTPRYGSQTPLHHGSRTPGQSGAWIRVTRHTLQVKHSCSPTDTQGGTFVFHSLVYSQMKKSTALATMMSLPPRLKAMAGPPTLRPRGSRKCHHHRSTLSTTPKLLEHQLWVLTHLLLQMFMGFITVARPLTFECVHLYCVFVWV